MSRVLDRLRGVPVTREEDIDVLPRKPAQPRGEHPAVLARQAWEESERRRQETARREGRERTAELQARDARAQDEALARQDEWARERDRLAGEVVVAESALAELQTGGVDLSSVPAAVESARNLSAVMAAEEIVEKARARVANHRNPNAMFSR